MHKNGGAGGYSGGGGMAIVEEVPSSADKEESSFSLILCYKIYKLFLIIYIYTKVLLLSEKHKFINKILLYCLQIFY